MTIAARPDDSTATIEGLGVKAVPYGTNTFNVVVTAENGDERVYEITVTRPISSTSQLNNIVINGLVKSLCGSTYCNLEPGEYRPNVTNYSISVPSKIKQLQFVYYKSNYYQEIETTYEGIITTVDEETGEETHTVGLIDSLDGKVTLGSGTTTVNIKVRSEYCSVNGRTDSSCYTTYTYNITRNTDSDADLLELEVLDPEIDIHFDTDITEYYLTIPNEYTSINSMRAKTDADQAVWDIVNNTVTSETDNETNVIVSGNEDFSTGLNIVTITVTSKDGTVGIYTLNVYRSQSSNVFLDSLEVSSGEEEDKVIYPITPEFNQIIDTYYVTVPNNITNIDIVATVPVSDDIEPSTISGDVGNLDVNVGVNSFNIIVTAEDGSIQIYKVMVTREKNGNSKLSGLSVMVGEEEIEIEDFDPDTLTYTVNVPEGTTSIELIGVPEVDTTTTKILDGSSIISAGTTSKRIMAIAENGTNTTYTVDIVRPASSNNYLSDLIVMNDENRVGVEDFDKNTTEYTINVDNEVRSLNVTGVKEFNTATIYGNGTYYLNTGSNEIEIICESEDKTSKTYKITVNGFRIPLFSEYRNILKATEVK
jgi:hypothetical protein